MAKEKKNQTAEAAKKNIQSLSAAFDDDDDMQVEDTTLDDALAALFDDIDTEQISSDIKEAEASGVEMIDVTKLIPNKYNKYQMDEDDETYKAIKSSILKVGFMNGLAVIGEKREDGKVIIISGHRRTKIAKSLGLEKLPITYIECGSDVNRLRYSIRTNLHRKDSVRDTLYNYKAIEAFYEAGEYSKEETKLFETKRHFIANELGMEEGTLRNLVFLLNIDERIWTLIDKGVVTTSAIRTLYGKRNEYKNYASAIRELCENETLLDRDIDIKDRQSKAKAIIDSAKSKGRPKGIKKCHTEMAKLYKTVSSIKDSADTFIRPANDAERKVALSSIENIERVLADIKQEIIDSH